MDEEKRSESKKPEKVEAELVEPKKGYGVNGNLVAGAHTLTVEEQSRGGLASAESRRRKKELREFTKDFLMQDAVSTLKQNMAVVGVEADQMSNLAAMVIRLFSKAVNQGDLNAARTIIEWAGMAPLQQEQENAAIAKMSQVMQLADGRTDEDEEDVIFYIPDNGRKVFNAESAVVDGGEADGSE